MFFLIINKNFCDFDMLGYVEGRPGELSFRIPFRANLTEPALRAFRIPRRADVAPVQYQPVVCGCPVILRDQGFKVPLNGFGSASGGEPEPVGYPEDMGIDSDDRFVIYDGRYHIRRLAAYAGQRHKFVDSGRHLASEIREQLPCHADKMLRLAPGIRDAGYKGENLVK